MLVLTRKAGEAICIGDDVEVRIVSVKGRKVRIAVEAPREMNVRRKELEEPEDRLRLSREERSPRERTSVRKRAAS